MLGGDIVVSIRDVVEEFMWKRKVASWTWYTIKEHNGKNALFFHDEFVTYTTAKNKDDEISEEEVERIKMDIENFIKRKLKK